MNQNAILCGHIGEFGWEVLRFAPHIFWLMKEKYPNSKLILCTRKDRIELYGDLPTEILPFNFNNQENSDCFTITGLQYNEYKYKINQYIKETEKKYNIQHIFFPRIEGKRYTEKYQILENEKIYNFKPTKKQLEIFNIYIPNDKFLITIAPRYRKGFKRNWPYWNELFEMIYKDKFLYENFNFIICGIKGQFIKPINNFYDINDIPNGNISGLTMSSISKSILTIGSQSGIPNLSNLMRTPTIQWGNEKHLHKGIYNVNNTECIFIEDMNFKCPPNIIFDNLKTYLLNFKEKYSE